MLSYSDIIQPLVPWMDEGVCDVSINKELASIKYRKLDLIISFLMDQTPLIDIYKSSSFCTWKIDFDNTSKPEQIVDYFARPVMEWPIVIQKSSESIFFELISPYILNVWLLVNSKSRYLAIPVSLNKEYTISLNSAHACILIFDNALSQVYFFDPNGSTTFFGSDNEIYIDKVFNKYFDNLNSHNSSTTWSFIKQKTFNPNKFCLNRLFLGSLIENSGNCLITIILFAHFLQITQTSLNQAINMLGSLTDFELITIINGYSVGICRIGNELV
jgi:hypothetical protein